MFKGQDSKAPAQDTIIASGVKVEGDFNSQGNIIIDGEVIGSLKTDQDLFVGEGAKISASVAATNAKISGTVHGNIKVKERLELAASSKIIGDIKAKILSVEPGATLNGKLTMGDEAAVREAREQEVSTPKPVRRKSFLGLEKEKLETA